MRISEESFRAPRNVTERTPKVWGLMEGDNGDPRPFVFELEIQPPGEAHRKRLAKAQNRQSKALAGYQLASVAPKATPGVVKILEKENRKTAGITAPEQRSRQQKVNDAVREESLVWIRQLFDDGTRAEMTEAEVDFVFAVPENGSTAYAFAASAAEGYEPVDVGGEEVLELLREHGEPLHSALVRFVSFHTERAKTQAAERDESEVFGPLGSTADSSHGSSPE